LIRSKQIANEEFMTQEKVIPPARFAMPDDSSGFALAERAAYFALVKKAEDVVILDLRGLSDVCDFFVVASGQADVQVRAIARAVTDGLREADQTPVGVEGTESGRWALIDYFDVVVHVFRPEVRDYYQIERLWDDAGVLAIPPEYVATAGFRDRHADLPPPPAAAMDAP
jgi:ribosome-associated protein